MNQSYQNSVVSSQSWMLRGSIAVASSLSTRLRYHSAKFVTVTFGSRGATKSPLPSFNLCDPRGDSRKSARATQGSMQIKNLTILDQVKILKFNYCGEIDQ